MFDNLLAETVFTVFWSYNLKKKISRSSIQFSSSHAEICNLSTGNKAVWMPSNIDQPLQ
jgi:hypothetical protein